MGGRHFNFYRNLAKISLGSEHYFLLSVSHRKYNRIKIIIRRSFLSGDSDDEFFSITKNVPPPPPSPKICAKVRHFVDESLSEQCDMWMCRMSYHMVVTCPCECKCRLHGTQACTEEECLHFLNLDECISRKVVSC